MQPLTQNTPKPLLKAGGITLLERHILSLRDAGITEIVVNAAYLAEQIVQFCGDGSRWHVHIDVTVEAQALETAGGIINALPLLGDAPFVLINGDIFCDVPLSTLIDQTVPKQGAHILLVNNPAHNTAGDFILEGRTVKAAQTPTSGRAASNQTLTYAGLGIYHPDFFKGYDQGKRPLKPLLDAAIHKGRLAGSHWQGQWLDVGTPERLALLDKQLRDIP